MAVSEWNKDMSALKADECLNSLESDASNGFEATYTPDALPKFPSSTPRLPGIFCKDLEGPRKLHVSVSGEYKGSES